MEGVFEPTGPDGLPPYVEAPQPVQVRAMVARERRDAWVLGWRGERVYLRWQSPAGNHLGWVPASDVDRVLCGDVGGRTDMPSNRV
jgi:hypothetical protein